MTKTMIKKSLRAYLSGCLRIRPAHEIVQRHTVYIGQRHKCFHVWLILADFIAGQSNDIDSRSLCYILLLQSAF